MRPPTSSLAPGFVTPIPTFHPAVTRIFSVPLVRVTKSTLSVVPTKFVVVVVPAFPRIHHPANDPVAAACQLARPVASDTRIFHIQGLQPCIRTCPLMSSLDPGVEVPIPTSPLLLILMSSVSALEVTFADVIVPALSLEKSIGFALFVAIVLRNHAFFMNQRA